MAKKKTTKPTPRASSAASKAGRGIKAAPKARSASGSARSKAPARKASAVTTASKAKTRAQAPTKAPTKAPAKIRAKIRAKTRAQTRANTPAKAGGKRAKAPSASARATRPASGPAPKPASKAQASPAKTVRASTRASAEQPATQRGPAAAVAPLNADGVRAPVVHARAHVDASDDDDLTFDSGDQDSGPATLGDLDESSIDAQRAALVSAATDRLNDPHAGHAFDDGPAPRSYAGPTGPTDPHTFAIETARLCRDDKCEDVTLIDVRAIGHVSDFIIIASGTSDRQMRSVARHVQDHGQRRGFKLYRSSVDDRGTWILADFVEVVVHLFEPNTRAHYDMEMLWGDAPRIAWERPDQVQPQHDDQ